MKKVFLCIICVISIIITIIITFSTYSKYSEQAEGNLKSHVGKWNIKLNNTDITQGTSYNFTIDDITIIGNDNVVEGKIAPATSGYFSIEIDPSNTDVSVKYTITIDSQNLTNEKLHIVGVTEANNNTLIRTDEYAYTGVIPLSDIQNNVTHTVRVEIIWENDNLENDEDLEYAKSLNNALELPISVDVIQYTGETITPYN